MRAVQLTSLGDPVERLQCVDIREPDAPGPNQVLIGVENFPPSTRTTSWSRRASTHSALPLPAVIGNEGVGLVLAVGRGWRASRSATGSWRRLPASLGFTEVGGDRSPGGGKVQRQPEHSYPRRVETEQPWP
ncbi:MAG: hypothetical protein WBX25_17340 [Rhodomicrobium sp.]